MRAALIGGGLLARLGLASPEIGTQRLGEPGLFLAVVHRSER